MRKSSEMNDRINAIDERTPVDRLPEVGVLHDFDAAAQWRVWRPPDGGANRMAVGGKRGNHGPANKAGCTGDEETFHRIARRLSG
jgi:hypothetical protein